MRILFVIIIMTSMLNGQEITISWVYQPDKSFDFTVGEREGAVTLKDGQGVRFDRLWVDSTHADFVARWIQDERGKGFYLTAPEGSQAAFIDEGKREIHTLPLASEAGYDAKPLPLISKHTYSIKTADGFHYAKIHVLSQYWELPETGKIVTGDTWVPAEVTYAIPVVEEKLDEYELPYLDEDVIVKGRVNIEQFDVIEQITDERRKVSPGEIEEIIHYPTLMRDTIQWRNLGKVLKYFKMKRRYTRVDIEEGFMDFYLGNGDLVTVFPPDSQFVLFQRDDGETDSLYFTGFFWMEELGKSKYNYVWKRTYQERKEKKFIRSIRFE